MKKLILVLLVLVFLAVMAWDFTRANDVQVETYEDGSGEVTWCTQGALCDEHVPELSPSVPTTYW